MQVLPLERQERAAAEAQGSAGNLLLAVQAGGDHVPEGQVRALWQSRGPQGRPLHSAHARCVLHVSGRHRKGSAAAGVVFKRKNTKTNAAIPECAVERGVE